MIPLACWHCAGQQTPQFGVKGWSLYLAILYPDYRANICMDLYGMIRSIGLFQRLLLTQYSAGLLLVYCCYPWGPWAVGNRWDMYVRMRAYIRCDV